MLPFKYSEIGNVASGVVQIGDGSNVGATNIFGVVSLKNPTESLSYTSTNCTNTPGGLSVYKNLNIGSSLGVASSSVFGGNMSVGGNITNTITTASTTYLTGAIVCNGGIGIAGVISCNSAINTPNSMSCGGFTNAGQSVLSYSLDSSSISSGAMFCNGGIGIAKIIYTGTGIMLPTTGGTASLLNYYEEYTITNLWGPSSGGAWMNSTNLMSIVRIGKIIHLKILYFVGDSLGGCISNSSPIAPRLCPVATTSFLLPVQNTGTIQTNPGLLVVYASGYTRILLSPAGSGVFASGATSGLVNDVNVSWNIM